MLEDVLKELLASNEEARAALETLKKTLFHTYTEEESTIYEDDALGDYNWANGVTKVCVVFDEGVFKTSVSGNVTDYDYDSGEYLDEPVFDEWGDDWCKVEYEVYRAAVEAGIGHMFAETILADCGVYFQERSQTLMEDFPFIDVRNRLIEKFEVDNDDDLSIVIGELIEDYDLSELSDKIGYEYMGYFLSCYDTTELKALQNFLDAFDVNDLHAANIGWFADNTFKLFDFCGFCSRTADRVKENSAG